MKRQLFIIALLLMPISITYLHAQENKHAQAMYKAFREAINCKLPKNISSKWVSDSEDSLSRFFDNPDGGGLVPKNKIHEVKLGKDKVEIGPNYLDTWNFEFNNVPAGALCLQLLQLCGWRRAGRLSGCQYRLWRGWTNRFNLASPNVECTHHWFQG